MFYLNRLVNSFLSKSNFSQKNLVIEVNSNDYNNYDTYYRKDGLFVYGLSKQELINDDCEFNFEVIFIKDIFIKEKNVYSVFRGKNLDETVEVFNILEDKLPVLNKLCPQVITTDNLQKIVDYSKNFPQQTLAHICSHFNFMDYFKADKELTYFNKENLTCPITNYSPLCLAILSENIPLISFFMNFDFFLDNINTFEDKEKGNILHLAANTNKGILELLCNEENYLKLDNKSPKKHKNSIKKLINKSNQSGVTPLYIACSLDKPECVKVLIKYGANLNSAALKEKNKQFSNFAVPFDISKNLNIIDQLDVKEMKNGGTPLHWIKNTQCIEVLLDMNCDIDAKNFKGETPLHTFINKKNFKIVMSLLWHGASVDAIDTFDQTPLHLAVLTDDISIVQAIIVFGANVNYKNINNETPRHLCSTSNKNNQDIIIYILHTVGAERCKVNSDKCNDGCALNGSFNGKNKDSPCHRTLSIYEEALFSKLIDDSIKEKKKNENNDQMEVENSSKTCRILCLDGGGIRGLILIQMLSILELLFNMKVNNMFDFVSGTSTGSICALAFGIGMSANKCRKLYFRLKDKIFTGIRPYEEAIFENFLKKEFGDTTTVDQIYKLRVLIPVTKADQFPVDCHFFRNYKSPDEILEEISLSNPIEKLIWYIARSSGAAPTYFKPCGKYIDGGLISNNPTLDTLTEITNLNNAYRTKNQFENILNPSVVVSLGTGLIPVISIPKIGFSSIFEIYQSANTLLGLLIEQSTQSNGQVVKRCNAWCNSINVPFFRLNPPISENIPLNETNNEKLVKMLWETTAYMYNRKNDLLKLKELLI